MQAIGARLGLDLDREGDRFVAREPIAEAVGAWIGARRSDEVARTCSIATASAGAAIAA